MKTAVLFVVVTVAFAFGTVEGKGKAPTLGSKSRVDVHQSRENRGPRAPKKPKQGIVGMSIIVSCPVVGPGAPPCMVAPFPTSLTVIEHKKDKMEALGEVATDESGMFVIELKPGIYTLVPWVPMAPEDAPDFPPPLVVPYPVAFPVTVEVKRGEFTIVDIQYDNGAR